jgi:hypothetical protein
VPSAPEPAGGAQTSSQAVLVGTPATTAPAETASSPIYTKWWFWTLVGAAVVGAGIGVAAATGTFDKTQEATCPSGFACPR